MPPLVAALCALCFALAGACARPFPTPAPDTPASLAPEARRALPYALPSDVGLSAEKLERLGSELGAWVQGGEIVGTEILVVKDGKAVFHEAYGWSDAEEGQRLQLNAIFPVWSMTKPVTATAVLMLKEKGALALSDPVSRYVPGFPDDGTTLHHLLSHTSGFGPEHGIADGAEREFSSLRSWVESFAAQERADSVGQYNYSDFNFAVLGYVVERITGEPVERLIQSNILDPLGMGDTYMSFSPDAPWADRMSSRHLWNDTLDAYDRSWSTAEEWPWPYFPAGWGLFSTATDYARFLSMWMHGGEHEGAHLLSTETVERALRPHAGDARSGYGHGWMVRHGGTAGLWPVVFYHGGWGQTLAVALPDIDAMVIYLTQSRGRNHRAVFWNRLGRLEIFDHPGPYDEALIRADTANLPVQSYPEELTRYVGIYAGVQPDGREIELEVWQEGGLLHLQGGEPGRIAALRYHLVPLGEDRFRRGRYRDGVVETIDPDLEFRFRPEAGRASALELRANDRTVLKTMRQR